MLNDASLSALLSRIENLFEGQPASSTPPQKLFPHSTSDDALPDLTDELDRYLASVDDLSDSSQTSSPSTQFIPNASPQFEFVLNALTTSSGRVNEKTTTYLNQGHPYEIKFRINHHSSSENLLPATYRSRLRLCFWDKVLQTQEHDLMQKWLNENHSASLFDIDMNLTYGVLSIIQSEQVPNAVEIVWEPSATTSLFLRFKCTSTDFAPRRHGGEKGIPLRLQIDTYYENDLDDIKHVHSCCCKIQLFRLKGAQRKIKADRLRIEKLSSEQRRHYQTVCEYTVLQPCHAPRPYIFDLLSCSHPSDDLSDIHPTDDRVTPKKRNCSTGFLFTSSGDTKYACADEGNTGVEKRKKITVRSTNEDVLKWLNENHFSSVLNRFEFYTGVDMLRLTFDDLRQLCNEDYCISIRLYNQLNETILPPLKTLYMKTSASEHFSVIYLHELTRRELLEKLFQLIQQPAEDSWNLVLEFRKIRVHIDHDNVVKYSLPNEGQFDLKISSHEFALCLINSPT